MANLPPFPVDDGTLDMLEAAIDPRTAGDTTAERSSVGTFLEVMSQLGGSDITAVEEEINDALTVMRDPQYGVNDVMVALIGEIRRLRTLTLDPYRHGGY